MKVIRPSGLNFKQTVISGSKKSVIVQHNAGKLFRQWGEVNICIAKTIVLYNIYYIYIV